MSQTPVPFSSSFRSLTLNVTTGTVPNQVTHTQPITSVFQGNNSFPITDAGILNAFNSQAVGTSFTPSIDAKYGSDSNGNALTTISTPSVASFIPRPLIPISRASNNVTIHYTGVEEDIPIFSARFFQADPRNTGSNEWFAVVRYGMRQAITDYAKGLPGSSSPFTPPGQSQPVTFNNIVTTCIPDMSDMFNGVSTFNYDISEWDTEEVENMRSMFENAFAFNQNIGSWNVSNVKNMSGMFSSARAFNNDGNSSIGLWNVSKVEYMYYMFAGATTFNQNISNWNVSFGYRLVSDP